MAATLGSIRGLHNALRVRTGEGTYTVDPSQDPAGYANLLGRSHDERVRTARATEDAMSLPPGIDPAQNRFFQTFNRGQEDAAMGPAGYNRPWAGFFEAPKVLADNNPGHTYKFNYSTIGPTAGDVATLAPSVAALRRKAAPLPESHEDFMRRLMGNDPASLAAAGYVTPGG